MGMYTELNIGCELNKNTPEEVIHMIKYMGNKNESMEEPEIPNHELFKCDRWRSVLIGESYYFSAKQFHAFEYDEISKCWVLTNISNLKNYHSEIEKFLDWISPYISNIGFIGYMRYEEDDMPTLIIIDRYNHKITLKQQV